MLKAQFAIWFLILISQTLISNLVTPLIERLFNKSIIVPPIHIQNSILNKHVTIMPNCRIINSLIKEFVYINPFNTIIDSEVCERSSINSNCTLRTATIGRYSSISWNVTVGAIQHSLENISSIFCKTQQVNVGNDVLIGANSVIFPNVHIGDGSVIGANSIIKADVPDYAIVAGAPARVIKYRFTKQTIEELTSIQWWRLPPKIFNENISLFMSPATEETIAILKELMNSCQVK